MATVNPVTSLDSIAPLTSLAHLIDHRPTQQLSLDTPEGMKKTIGLMIDQIRKISQAIDLSDLNFETLYTNDGSLNTAASTNLAYVEQTSNTPTFDPTVAGYYLNTITATLASSSITITLSNIPATEYRFLIIRFLGNHGGNYVIPANAWPASVNRVPTGYTVTTIAATDEVIFSFICTSTDVVRIGWIDTDTDIHF